MKEFELAKDKVMMGAERKSMVMTEDEKKATAYHEAGHALVSLHVDGCDPLHKVTIIPRGRALGVTWNLPERDRYSMSMKQMKARLALCFGGRIAEQLIYGEDELNTGASNDIQQATDMARAMVMEYGMSEKLGWLRYRDNQEEVFLGHSVARSQSVSEETARLIDQEVRRLIEEAEATARKVLTDNLDELHRLAGALLEYRDADRRGSQEGDQGRGYRPRGSSDRRPRPPVRLLDPQHPPPRAAASAARRRRAPDRLAFDPSEETAAAWMHGAAVLSRALDPWSGTALSVQAAFRRWMQISLAQGGWPCESSC